MKKLFCCTLSLLTSALLFNSKAATSRADEPIITIHSTAWQEVGEDNLFSIFLGTYETETYSIDMGGVGLYDIDVEPGTINTETGEWDGTWIPASATEKGIIKIYGNPENLNILTIDGAYVESIEMSQCTNLEVLSLQHNVLKNLDLTPFENLYALYLSDNPFDGDTSIVVGANKPYLTILELDIIDKMGQGFNLSDYPSMMVFDAYHNLDLKAIDTSGCPKLISLTLEMTDVAALDVSNNPLLYSLNISETRITDIDISNLSNLQLFHASHDSGWINQGYRLNSIDTSNNPQLFYLNLSGNYLGHLDLTNNPLLTNLLISRNGLTEIDLSNNTELYSVSLMFNDLDFATLPWPEATWGEYFYRQNDLSLPRSIAMGEEIDLSKRVLRDGTTTEALVWGSHIGEEDYLIPDTEYSYQDGKILFNRTFEDSVYVEFTNNVFYDYSLKTSKFMVKPESEMGKPSKIVSANMARPTDGTLRFAIGLSEASTDNPKNFFVELNGSMLEFESTFAEAPTGYNVEIPVGDDFNGNVGIYIPENSVMTSISLANCELYGVNLTGATEIRYLDLNGCGLYNVDLSYNRCLEYIDVSNNNLTVLDLKGIYGNYEKNKLFTIKAAHNKIQDYNNFIYNDNSTFHYLDLSYNLFGNFKLLEFENLDYVDLSHNYLCEELYITYQITASHIDLSYNLLPSVVMDRFENLDYINLEQNNFTLATLPLPSQVNAKEYIYAPQLDYQLSMSTPIVDLSAQNRVVDGIGTTFTWYQAEGTQLVEGVDYECTDGVTKFLNHSLGEVYCTMTNPAFPMFEGENVYRTTCTTPVSVPTELVASFVTLKNDNQGNVTFTASRKTELYIDWRGDGSEYTVYPVGTSYISYPNQVTYAGAEVKIYTYESADLITVFSVTDIPMTNADFSALSQVMCLNLSGSQLSAEDVVLPNNAPITEFSMSDCQLTSFPWAETYPTIQYLVLSNNLLTEFDGSRLPKLGNLYIAGNQISKTYFDNPYLWSLSIGNNKLEDIDISGLPNLEQVDFSDNLLSTIDLSPAKDALKVLSLAANCFTFSTLPLPADLPKLFMYYYGSQAALQAQCVNGCVDLSCAAYAGDVPSTYTWYIEGEYDYDNQVWTGEQLIEGEDYEMEDGVAMFLHTIDSPVMAVITNTAFPNLTMQTDLITIDSAGINEILGDSDKLVNLYNLQGIVLKTNVTAKEALNGLAAGWYILGDKKIRVK